MNALSLIVGIIVGAAVASAAWFFAVAARRKKLEEQQRAKEEVMASIGELLADADAYEASYRCGTLTADRFSRGLIDRVNAISRPLRTNMHILDVFFVKYAEQQVDEYMRMIENPERRAEARKAIYAAVSEGSEEADSETRFGIAPIAVTPAARLEEAADTIAEEQDIFDAGTGQEDTFAPPPVALEVGVGEDEDAFELPEPEELAFEDAVAEEEAPPEEPPVAESAAQAVPEEEQVFGEPPEPPAPEQDAAADDSWGGEKSLEEFEAEFAKFEEPETPEKAKTGAEEAEQYIEVSRETGDFFLSEPEPAAKEPEPEPEPEPELEPEAEAEAEEEDIFDIQALPPADSERTETQQFDKPPAVEEPAHAAAEHEGITGDDVSDAIDNFFKIK